MADAPVDGHETETETEQPTAPAAAAETPPERIPVSEVPEVEPEESEESEESEADGDADADGPEEPAAETAGETVDAAAETTVLPSPKNAAFDVFAAAKPAAAAVAEPAPAKPAPVPVAEPDEVAADDESDEDDDEAAGDEAQSVGSDESADADHDEPGHDAAADHEEAAAEADEASDTDDDDDDDDDGTDVIGLALLAPEADETTLIPKVIERPSESTSVMPPVPSPQPDIAQRPYTAAPAGYGRPARPGWTSPPEPGSGADAQPTEVHPAVAGADAQPTRVQPAVPASVASAAAPGKGGTSRGYRPPEFHTVDPSRRTLPPPQNFKLDRREADAQADAGEKPRHLGRRALLVGGGVAVATAAGLTAAGVIKLPGTTAAKAPTVGFAPATNSGASAATQTGGAFLTAWQSGDLEAAANITDHPEAALAALQAYKSNLGVVGMVVNPNAANSVGWMTYSVTTQAGSPMGQWESSSGFATYSKQVDGFTRWFVEWSPAILYTSLKAGYQLKIKKTPSSIKGLVDRNGAAIDPAAHPSLAGIITTLTKAAMESGGTDGQDIIMVDDKGNQLASVAVLTPPIDNGTVATTLDMTVQSAAEAAVTFKPNSSIVAIKPSSGHILAIANNTTSQYYDNALLAAVAPGSTFKIITSTALLVNKIVTLSSTAPCPTTLDVDNTILHNSEGEGSMTYTYDQDFAQSCNNAFSNFWNAPGMTKDLLSNTAKTYFGLNQAWDIGLGQTKQYANIPSGLVAANLAESLVGQWQVVACPLAMCSVAATVANGSFKQPVLLPKQAQIAATALPSSVQLDLKTMMSDVISSGTAAKVGFPNNGHFYGKTGTAEVGSGASQYNNSWFVVFDDQHDIAVCALGIDGSYGATTAAPECLTVFKKLGYA